MWGILVMSSFQVFLQYVVYLLIYLLNLVFLHTISNAFKYGQMVLEAIKHSSYVSDNNELTELTKSTQSYH